MDSRGSNSTSYSRKLCVCSICGNSFTRHADVSRHIRNDHELDPFLEGFPKFTIDSEPNDSINSNEDNSQRTTPDPSHPSVSIISSSWVERTAANGVRSKVPTVTDELDTGSSGTPAASLESEKPRDESAERAIDLTLRASIMASADPPGFLDSGEQVVEPTESVLQDEDYPGYAASRPTAPQEGYESRYTTVPTSSNGIHISQISQYHAHSNDPATTNEDRARSQFHGYPTLEVEDAIGIEDWRSTKTW